ncbi:MAG TPA: cytochrome P450 [Acidimicrobiales bacterium]|nr:cytochrome P450 [Acidimicrobiales bacterium]
MTATAPDADSIDLSDLDWWTRPLAEREAAFAVLRAERPLAPMVLEALPGLGVPETPYWSITRYADIVEVSRHPELFCSGQGTNIPDLPPEFLEFFGSMINMDDPRHGRMRRIVSRGFTPRQLETMRADVEGVAAGIVDEIIERGECDFVTEVAARLPLRIIVDMMGIPRSQERFIFDRTNIILGFSDPEYVDDIDDPPAVTATILTAGAELAQMVQELGEARQNDPRNDLVTALVTSEVEGEHLTPQELASFFILLVAAGNETTRNAIAHGLSTLSENPDQKARWLADIDGMTTTAVEEIVRWASPVIHFRRTVTTDGTRLGEHEFSEGEKVVLWYWSGNRDEAVFDDPHTFDVGRTPNDHIGFGGPGPHFCLGAHLARREISVMFRELLRRMPDIHSVGEPDRLRSGFINGIKHLHAEWTPGPQVRGGTVAYGRRRQ